MCGAGADARQARGDDEPSSRAADFPDDTLEIIFRAGDPLQRAFVRNQAAVGVGASERVADGLQYFRGRRFVRIDGVRQSVQGLSKLLRAFEH